VSASRESSANRPTQVILKHWREAVPNDRLSHLVKDATRAIVRALQIRLREHSVAFGHWAFLRVLWETDGLTQRELSEQVGVMEPTTFSALNAMEKLGLIKRSQARRNKKNVFVHLTRKGRLLKNKLVPLAVEVNDIAIVNLTPADISTTRRTLLAIIENLAYNESKTENKHKQRPSTQELGRMIERASKDAQLRARRQVRS
jgi:DNA-binding MarR family transcriptional regulator